MASVTWAAAVSGDWSNRDNWVDDQTGQHVVPGANDTVSIGATGGSYIVTLDVNATVKNFALVSPNATFTANGKTFTVGASAALTRGHVIWINSIWAGAAPLENLASMTVRGNSTISSPLTQRGSLLVEGTSAGSATLTVAESVTNTGTVRIGASANNVSANFVVTNGALTNDIGGKLISDHGNGLISDEGSLFTGPRTISANVINNGSVSLKTYTLLSKSGGSFENNGETVIEAEAGVSFGSNPTFTQSGGTLAINAANGFVMNGGTFGFTGGSLNGTPSLTGSTLNLTANSTAAFEMFGGTLTGSLGAGQSVINYGKISLSGSEYLDLSDNFVNNGSITVTTINETTGQKRLSQRSALRMANGTLVNNGTITFDNGPGGNIEPKFAANLTNNGTLNVNSGCVLAGQQHTNNGNINIGAEGSLAVSGGTTFTQAGGNLRQATDETFLLGLGSTFRYSGGTMTGVSKLYGPTLRLETTNPGSFLLMGGGTLVGDVAAQQTIVVARVSGAPQAELTSATGFQNAGTVTLLGVESKLIVTTGTLVNNGVINASVVGAPDGAKFINANLTNNGTLNANTGTVLTGLQHTNNGDINIAATAALTVSGGTTFTQAGGNLRQATDETFLLGLGSTFRYSGGTMTGVSKLYGPTLRLETINPASFLLMGGGTLIGDVAAEQTIVVARVSGAPQAILTSADDFENAGTITLLGVESKLIVTTGTLVNNGVINASVVGTPDGAKFINANLTNNGTLNINVGTVLTGQQHTNNGDVNIQATAALTLSGSTMFTQAGGNLRQGSDGTFSMGQGSTFRFNGGTIIGAPQLRNLTLDIGANSGPATISMRGGSTLIGNVLVGQTIKVQGDASAVATLTAANGFTNAGMIVLETVNGTSNASNLAVTSGTLTNLAAGTINVNAGGGGSRNLTTELANSGTVNINTATTLGRASADHANSGTINVAAGDLTVSQSGTTPTFTNSGTLNVSSGRTLNISGGTLANFNAGTLTGGNYVLAGTLKFPGAAITTNAATIFLNGAASQIVNESNTNALNNFANNTSSAVFRLQNGRHFVTGNGITQFANAGVLQVEEGASFTVGNGKKYQQTRGTTIIDGTLTTTDPVGADFQAGSLQGTGTIVGNLRNSAMIRFGDGPGDFEVNGNFTQTANGSLGFDVGGTTPIIQFDQLRITGTANLAGTFDVSLANSFVPAEANTFQFLTAGSQTGSLTPGLGTTRTSTTNFAARSNAVGQELFTNHVPTTTPNVSLSIVENTADVTTVAATDLDIPAQALSYRLGGGSDQAKFVIDNNGVLRFNAAPDFEVPADAGGDNTYNVIVQVSDGHGGSATQDVAVTITNANENPIFISNPTASIPENTTDVITLTATDADIPAQAVTLSVTGGADQALFEITDGNHLTFKTAPDFEQPADQGQDNIYNVQVSADDGQGGTATQDIAVTVQFVPPPVLVTVAVSPTAVVENGTGNLVFTFTRSATVGSLVVNFNVGGTATLIDSDYLATGATTFNGSAGTLTFLDGLATKTVTMDPTGDTTPESDETVILTVISTANYQAGSPGTATGTITNDDTSFAIAATSADKTEGNTGTTPFTFLVTRGGPTTATGSVKFAVMLTGDGAAQANDFISVSNSTLPSGTINFAAGETSKVTTINVVGETKIEGDEFFTVVLSNPTGGTITTGAASGAIRNDDAILAITPANITLLEGNSGSSPTTPFAFTITRTGLITGAASVQYAVTGIGAAGANAADFGGVLPTGTIHFAAGETTQPLAIHVIGDTLVEGNEGFTVTLSNPTAAILGTSTATGLINNDDDSSLSIAATAASKPEGNSGVTALTFTVTRNGTTTAAASANYSVSGSGINAASAEDFGGTFPAGTVNFAAGGKSKVITINVSGDTSLEPTETFDVSLSGLTGAALGVASATGTIVSDDSSFTIQPAAASIPEGQTGNTPFTFTVNRNGGTLGTASVKFGVTGKGTNPAVAADFGSALPSGTVSFAAGESSKTLTINVKADTAQENDEGFTVTLLSATGGTLGETTTAAGMILNDDSTLSIFTDAADQLEGNSGPTPFTFHVVRAGAAITPASVKYLVTPRNVVSGSNGSAATPADFGAAFPNGTLEFAAGESTKTLTINVNGDTAVESDEGFTVTLLAPTGATLGASTAGGTIRTDDTSLAIAATNATSANKHEGHAGSTPFTFTITRTGLLGGETSVNYSATGSGANPANADDFLPGEPTTGTVTFAAGETAKVITINIAGDTTVEPTETFTVTLSDAAGASGLLPASATGTIISDESSFSVTPLSASKGEGNTGNTPFTFTVTRIGATQGTGSVNFAVSGSGDHAAEISDFGTAFPTGLVSFKAGESSKVITVNVKGDAILEPDEGFTVSLSNPIGGILDVASTASGMILSDDATIALTTTSVVNDEGTGGTTPFQFTVTRTGGINVPASVKFAVAANGSGAAASNAADFGTAFPSGTISFAAGASERIITINVNADSAVENNESFKVTLSAPTAATLGTAIATGTILNDDSLLSIAATDPKAVPKLEGNTGSTPLTFTVTRSGDLRSECNVGYFITGSGANPTNAADFAAGSELTGNLTFAPNESAKIITVNAAGDSTFEADETFTVSLINPTVGTLGTVSALGTIKNDDSGLSISPANFVKAEGNSGVSAFTFTVSRTGTTVGTSTVDFEVEGSGDDPADEGDFSSALTGTLSFAANQASKTITVNVIGDVELEPDEGFTVRLVNPTGATLVTDTATGTIVSDDTVVSLELAESDGPEGGGENGQTQLTFLVRRSGAISGISSVKYAVSAPPVDPEDPVPAANGADFGGAFPSGTVSFAANETEKLIRFNIRGDTTFEPDEVFLVKLSAPTKASIDPEFATALGAIINDDSEPEEPQFDSGNEPIDEAFSSGFDFE